MTNAANSLFVAGLLAVLPAIAQSVGQLRVCVDTGTRRRLWS
jgi:hypothetical protein